MSRRPGRALLLPLLAGAVLVTCLLSLGLGSKVIALPDLLAAASGGGDEHVRAVLDSRVPRTLCGLLAGSALATSGGAIQAVTRNPLGDPGILGLASGAAAGVVTVTTVAGAAPLGLVGGAFAGALVATLVVLALGNLGRDSDGTRLLLAGAVVTAVSIAFTQAIALRDQAAFEALRFWSAGSLSGGASITTPVLVTLLVGAVLLAFCTRGLDALALGDTTATALGHRPGLVRMTTFLAVALLTAAATAVTGPIGFVGLAVPHVARALVGSSTRTVLACCVLLGPVVLLLADVLGRVVLRPEEIPVGVVTALLGAPLLLAVVRRARGAL